MKNYSWIPTFIMTIDQMTKRIAIFWEQNNICFSKFFFKNTIIYNKGISFGMFANSAYEMILYIFIISAIMFVIFKWKNARSKAETIAWGCILGGGLSNLFDRIFFQGVLDFIECSLSVSALSFPIFNIADIAIFIGFLILMSLYIKNKIK